MQLARRFAVPVYRIIENFPPEERYGLVGQLRRASVSIASNIAEGSAKTSVKNQAYFYQIAYSSSLEVLNQLIICNDLTFIQEPDHSEARLKIEEITNKINALRKSILNKKQ